MSRTPRVLVVGYNAFDVIVSVSAMPAADTKLNVPAIITCGGGPGATAAVALARLGCHVRILTMLTDDEGGRTQRRELEAAGVDTAGSPVRHGPGAKAVILVRPDDGARTILWSRGDLPPLPVPDDPEAELAGCDLLYLDGHETTAAAAMAAAARRRGLPVVLDAGSVREGTRDLVPLCTDVLASVAFLADYTGLGDPVAGLRALAVGGPARVGVTFGAAGALGLEDGSTVGVAAFAVAAADTTGAGDAFHAGYAAARLRGAGFPAALRFGAAVAALKCRGWGGRAALPTWPEAEAFAASAARRPAAAAVAGADLFA
ncbi:MAG TPA: PfkB family carbohydrate kinase [Candidatus Krumholzibacteria bacterium]|nr:PfkB family carbohydrate kinase [Candidatus Krumholzibacteria bacterium]